MAKLTKEEANKLPPLIECDGCIYYEYTDKSTMYCNRVKMPGRSDTKNHCINKKTTK